LILGHFDIRVTKVSNTLPRFLLFRFFWPLILKIYKIHWQDLVFSVKLKFGKTLVLVQNAFVFKKDFRFKTFFLFQKCLNHKQILVSRNILSQKKFRVLKFFDLRISLVQPKYVSIVILSPIFFITFFFRPKTFFGPKNLSYQKNFRPNFYVGTKTSFGPKFFMGQNKILDKKNFLTKFFWTKPFFKPKISFWPYFFFDPRTY